ncbi:hypothetical protein LTR66_007802 [Elasticomyces elasticus]|nr:hypothetical protein LTR66_007802 [Elasticomyces elasticus]
MSCEPSSTSSKETLPADQGRANRDNHPSGCRPDDEKYPPMPLDTTKTTHEAYRVRWAPDDPENPRNWSFGYKSWITFLLSMLSLSASLGSSIISPAEKSIATYTHVSKEVVVLSISLYILGFAFGPLCWAPVSELFGRKVSMLPAMFCLGLFSIGTATSQNAQSVLVTRFFAGLFGSAPVSNVSAALGDVWDPKARGMALTLYAVAVVGGPTIGPIIGSAIVTNKHLGWRWTQYTQAIWVFAVLTVCVFALPELYEPVLLHRRAKRLRKESGNENHWHPHESHKLTPRDILTKHLARPLRMLFTEPMVTCIALYASFVYALLYFTLEVFPIVFEEERGWKLVVSTLPFLGLFVGVIFAVFINLANQPRYIRIVDANGGKPVPEARLLPMVTGGILFAAGLFWFGWTAAPQFHWAHPVVAAGLIGAGFNTIFQQCINFLVDTYGLYAASAVSANTFLRSILAAGFPLVAQPMFHNLGVGPAMSILGAIASLALPVPFIFMKYGLVLRKMSKFAPVE